MTVVGDPAAATFDDRRIGSLERDWPVLVGRAAVPVVLLLVWHLAHYGTDLIPSISGTATEFRDGLQEGWLITDLVVTMKSFAAGFALAVVIGVAVGTALGLSRLAAATAEPMITGTFAVPRIIFYPTLVAIFGVGFRAEAVMAATAAVFPIILATAAAVRNVDPVLVRVGRTLCASPTQMARKFYLPVIAPGLIVGLRLSWSIGFATVVIAEFWLAIEGVGVGIRQAYAFQDYERLFAIVLPVIALAVVGTLLLWAVERRLVPDSASGSRPERAR